MAREGNLSARVANRTTQLVRYEKWRNGELVATELHRFALQHWGLREFAELLGDAGFVDVRVSTDYRDENPPNPNSRTGPSTRCGSDPGRSSERASTAAVAQATMSYGSGSDLSPHVAAGVVVPACARPTETP